MGWLGKLFGGGTRKEETMKMGPAAMKEHGKEVIKMAKDLVCGMECNEKTAAKSQYQGKTYYFCAAGCKKAFDANPDKYIKSPGQSMPGHSH